MTHSPFPWITHPQAPTNVYDANGMKVSASLGPNAEDNAALIAAIPAMVSVLEGLLVDNDGDEGDDACELCDGCGEVSAVTTRSDRDSVGCPACIERASSRAARAVLASIGKTP